MVLPEKISSVRAMGTALSILSPLWGTVVLHPGSTESIFVRQVAAVIRYAAHIQQQQYRHENNLDASGGRMQTHQLSSPMRAMHVCKLGRMTFSGRQVQTPDDNYGNGRPETTSK